MPRTPDRTYVSLNIIGLGDHRRIVNAMDWEPDEAWSAGDIHPMTKRVRQDSGCIYRSGIDTAEPLETHIREFLISLEMRTHSIQQLSLEYAVELSCSIHYTDWTPGIHLDRDMLRSLAMLGVTLDLDLYFEGEDEEGDTT